MILITKSNYKERKKIDEGFALPFASLLLLSLMLVFSAEIKLGVMRGASLAFTTILPTLFPFFVISDLLQSVLTFKGKMASKAFERLFGVNGCAISAFIIGSVCGFPLGVKCAVNAYREGLISVDECERLCAFSSNPSAAFVIAGIGAGVFGDIIFGVKLYCSVIFASVIVGMIFKRNIKFNKKAYNPRQSFDVVNSISSAAQSCIKISAFIIFFCSLTEFIGIFIKNQVTMTFFASVFEIGTACKFAQELLKTAPFASVIFTAFALGFSGLSVHLQSFSLMPKELSRKKFFIMKLLHGVFASVVIIIVEMIKK